MEFDELLRKADRQERAKATLLAVLAGAVIDLLHVERSSESTEKAYQIESLLREFMDSAS